MASRGRDRVLLSFSGYSLFHVCVCWVEGKMMQAGDGHILLGLG